MYRMIIDGHTPTTAEEPPFNDGNVYRSYDEDLDCVFTILIVNVQ
jgi:hypothetical protein